MKLLTQKEIKKLEKHPIGSQDEKGYDAEVLFKLFSPVGMATWYITEGDQYDDDWEFFGYCILNDLEMSEFGYVTLNQLKSLRLPYGLSVEREIRFKPCTVREALKNDFNYEV